MTPTLKITQHRVDREALLKMPESRSKLFLVLAHAHTEISVLLRLAFSVRVDPAIPEPEQRGRNTQSMLMLRILIGKLNEAYCALRNLFLVFESIEDYESGAE
jgi:hypothetical protein